MLRDTTEALSKVFATVQASHGIGRLLDAFEDVFTARLTQPRIAGSTDRKRFCTTICPSPGFASGA